MDVRADCGCAALLNQIKKVSLTYLHSIYTILFSVKVPGERLEKPVPNSRECGSLEPVTIMPVFSKPITAKYRVHLLVAVAVLLVSRSRLADVSRLVTVGPLLSDKASPEDLKKAQQQIYVEEKDGSKTLLLPFRKRVSKVDSLLVNGSTLITSQIPIAPISSEVFARDAPYFEPVPKTHKPNVDKVFLKQLIAILRIVFPSWTSKEIGILLLHTFFLVTRTVLSVYVAHLDGRLVRDIVSANGKGFLHSMGWWFALAVPSTYTNSMVSVLTVYSHIV